MAHDNAEEPTVFPKSPPLVPPNTPIIIARSDRSADITKTAAYLRENCNEQCWKIRKDGQREVEDLFDASDRRELDHGFLMAVLDQVAEANEEILVLNFCAEWSIGEVNGKFPDVMDIKDIETAFGGEKFKTYEPSFLQLTLKFIKGAYKQTADGYRAAREKEAESGADTSDPAMPSGVVSEAERKVEVGKHAEASDHPSPHTGPDSVTCRPPKNTDAKQGPTPQDAGIPATRESERPGELDARQAVATEKPPVRYRSAPNRQQPQQQPSAPPSVRAELLAKNPSDLTGGRNDLTAAGTAGPAMSQAQFFRPPQYPMQALPPVDTRGMVRIASQPGVMLHAPFRAPLQMTDQIVAAGLYDGYGYAHPHTFIGLTFHSGPAADQQIQRAGRAGETYDPGRVTEEPGPGMRRQSNSFSKNNPGQRRESSVGQPQILYNPGRFKGSAKLYGPHGEGAQSHWERAPDRYDDGHSRVASSSEIPRLVENGSVARPRSGTATNYQFGRDDWCDEQYLGRNRTEVTSLYVKGIPPKVTELQIHEAIGESARVSVKSIRVTPQRKDGTRNAWANFHNNTDTRVALAVGRIEFGDWSLLLTVPIGHHGFPRVGHDNDSPVPFGAYAQRGGNNKHQRGDYGNEMGGSHYGGRRNSESVARGPVYVPQSMRLTDPGSVPRTDQAGVEDGPYSPQDVRSDLHVSPQKERASYAEMSSSPEKRKGGTASRRNFSRRNSSAQNDEGSRISNKQQDRYTFDTGRHETSSRKTGNTGKCDDGEKGLRITDGRCKEVSGHVSEAKVNAASLAAGKTKAETAAPDESTTSLPNIDPTSCHETHASPSVHVVKPLTVLDFDGADIKSSDGRGMTDSNTVHAKSLEKAGDEEQAIPKEIDRGGPKTPEQAYPSPERRDMLVPACSDEEIIVSRDNHIEVMQEPERADFQADTVRQTAPSDWPPMPNPLIYDQDAAASSKQSKVLANPPHSTEWYGRNQVLKPLRAAEPERTDHDIFVEEPQYDQHMKAVQGSKQESQHIREDVMATKSSHTAGSLKDFEKTFELSTAAGKESDRTRATLAWQRDDRLAIEEHSADTPWATRARDHIMHSTEQSAEYGPRPPSAKSLTFDDGGRHVNLLTSIDSRLSDVGQVPAKKKKKKPKKKSKPARPLEEPPTPSTASSTTPEIQRFQSRTLSVVTPDSETVRSSRQGSHSNEPASELPSAVSDVGRSVTPSEGTAKEDLVVDAKVAAAQSVEVEIVSSSSAPMVESGSPCTAAIESAAASEETPIGQPIVVKDHMLVTKPSWAAIAGVAGPKTFAPTTLVAQTKPISDKGEKATGGDEEDPWRATEPSWATRAINDKRVAVPNIPVLKEERQTSLAADRAGRGVESRKENTRLGG